jgi:hypothetical protein
MPGRATCCPDAVGVWVGPIIPVNDTTTSQHANHQGKYHEEYEECLPSLCFFFLSFFLSLFVHVIPPCYTVQYLVA